MPRKDADYVWPSRYLHLRPTPVDTDALLRMREAMRLRGPDSAGPWSDQAQGIVLADRQVQIIFNGEVCNHPELRVWCETRVAPYMSNIDIGTL